MSYRFMRVLVLFDLPSVTSLDLKNYRNFRNYLIKSGFLMLQESVYCKLVLNNTAQNTLVENLNRNKPKKGLITVLTITEKQFQKMIFLIGEKNTQVLDSDNRIVIL
ncbi:CRISPR-associated endonuclease Cas2 [Caviibacter abscessus]|uniref:CRISPR-associated endonuclease Cas2 n=1 Tax=Caviibacter abscessus TaxID=1766719 RepID=UPI0018D26BF6|nr:CRISPR-associated endonuclease Cas2 [Caviibacter abscessus]